MHWILIFFIGPTCLWSQTINGQWEGYLSMEGYAGQFIYQLQLEETDASINGYSVSMTLDSSTQVRFQIAGSREGNRLILQELQQISPSPPEWCLKYSNLELHTRNDSTLLIGNWTGGDCNPGKIYLWKRQSYTTRTSVEEIPFSFIGKWTGHLDQSDRSYGFFYELELKKDGSGTSFIVSEGNGGSAFHDFSWELDTLQQVLKIREKKVIERTDPRWKWCIKSADLAISKTENGYQLDGDWWGHIEEDLSKKGTCAPGKMHLEKPILTKTVVEKIAQASNAYTFDLQRKININRVLEVKRPQLKIAVWDNGVYDGDIMTLYVNGKKVMEKYKVTKRKAYVDVELKEKNNFLVLHADDLGEISPNTVALSIYDGHREQVIVMSSNLEESGAILIKRVDLTK